MFLPKIYPITDTRIAKLTHVEQIERLIAGGAEMIQLRDKDAAPKNFYEAARAALKIARAKNVKIIINDRADIALALRADGVHLGQTDLPPECARKILGDAPIIGFSTHNLQQALEAAKMPIDYLAIGPIFTTKTKVNPDKEAGLETIKRIREAVGDFPIVAIGGINAQNFQQVLQAGANSVAVISDLLSDADQITVKIRGLLS